MSLRVAGAQMPVTTDIESNLAAIRRAIVTAAGRKADVLLTPDGSLSGYTASFDQQAVQQALHIVVTEAASAGRCCFAQHGHPRRPTAPQAPRLVHLLRAVYCIIDLVTC